MWKAPKTPNFDKEAREAVDADGLPSLQPTGKKGRVVFDGLKSVYMRNAGKVVEVFQTMDATKLTYRSGVTIAITSPSLGLVTAFSTGAKHKIDKEAMLLEKTAIYVSVSLGAEESVSTQIQTLRKGLLGAVNSGEGGDLGKVFKHVVKGEIPLLVTAESMDIIATIIKLKGEVESALTNNSKKICVTLVGAKEAHLLASEIAEAGVGVIMAPVRLFPRTWESLRILPGPLILEKTVVSTLMKHNVTVAIASDTSQTWTMRNTRWDVA
ncbi:hypothetical protein V5O48_016680 [Marasmius crinis-equi]|uniref:Uncharacterized protein n=1 Tax=Marasmius crinis-equi TaxID=585013 RepID=A0ABR3ER41_9AGAR